MKVAQKMTNSYRKAKIPLFGGTKKSALAHEGIFFTFVVNLEISLSDQTSLIFIIKPMKCLQQFLTTALLVGCIMLMMSVFLSQFAIAQELRWENGLSNFGVSSISVSSSIFYAGTGGGGVFRSMDSGATWIPTNTQMFRNRLVAAVVVNDNYVFAGTPNEGVYRSTDIGITWRESNTGLVSSSLRSLVVSNSSIFAVASNGVFRSSNNGNTWSLLNNRLNSNVQSLVVNGNTFFAGTYDGVYRTTNNDTSWTLLSQGMRNFYVQSLVVNGNTIFAGTRDSGVYRTSNNGNSWIQVNTGLSSKNISSLAVNGNTIFAGTNDGGVYLTANNGNSWVQINRGWLSIPSTYTPSVYTLVVSGNTLFAGTGNGIYRATLTPTSLIQNSTPEHLTFAPQPASERTRITIPSRAATNAAVLTVSDILGRQLIRMEGVPLLSGLNDVDVDVRTLAVGAYVVRVQAGEQVFVGMLHVVR